ncbi:hypothetical protein V6N13_091740 [Hibiscus sabdariffa]|uniref:MATH domain-containing protein n=1 Tax=Hibiscus sabdariffa TaxID=183260 RepID=A0ABR2QEU8_9ROSI
MGNREDFKKRKDLNCQHVVNAPLQTLNLLPLQVLQLASPSSRLSDNGRFVILSAGSNLPKVIWRVESLNSKSQSEDGDGEIAKVTWRIQNFSSFKRDQRLCSENFSVDGNKWNIVIYPKGNKVDHLSIYLRVADSATLPSGWTRFVQYGLAVIDQTDRQTSIARVTTGEFNAAATNWGYPSFLALSELEDSKRGYLVNDACLVEAYISTDRTDGLISHEFILETDSDGHKTKEADGATEPAEPTDEDMNTFFSNLESKLLSCKIAVSQEEVKQALTKLDEAMNMTPVEFQDSGKFSSLKQAFKILASFNYSSTTLTIEQKNVLNLVRYKEVESEFKRVEQKLAAFHEQVEETQKERENMLAEKKGMFRSSKKLKVKLEALEKKWAEYEAKTEVAEKEEKTVEAEWGRMKDFISSIKRRALKTFE